MKLKIALLVAGLLCIAPNAYAEWGDKAYDATYDQVMPGVGASTLRMSCDGQGHIRTEANIGGRAMVTIMDAKNKVSYTINDADRSVTKTPMTNPPGQISGEVQKTSLGTRNVEGHMCEGWQTIQNGHTFQSWVDTDIGCPILTTIDGKTNMRVRIATKQPIAANYFTVPSNYKVVDTSEQMRQSQEMARKYQQQKAGQR